MPPNHPIRVIESASGFDPDGLSALDPAARLRLALANAWGLAGIVACGLSAGLLAMLFGLGIGGAVAACAAVVVTLWALQAQALTAGMLTPIPLDAPPATSTPPVTLAVLMLLMGLAFSQPVLMGMGQWGAHPGTDSPDTLQRQMNSQQAREREDSLKADLARANEALTRVMVAAADASASEGPMVSQAGPPPGAGVRPQSTLAPPGGTRRALVIGNDAYQDPGVGPLKNAVKDSIDMERALSSIGFAVTRVKDGTRREMELAVEDFLRALQPGDISVFHFSGHGYQRNGDNYLAPVDLPADFANPANFNGAIQGVSMNALLEAFSRRHPQAGVFIIDACRSVDDAQSAPRARGLASIEAGQNTYIALAAKPGQVALENGEAGGNGLFTGAIVRQLRKSIDIDALFTAVRVDVARASQALRPGAEPQQTWSSSSLTAPLVLAAPGAKQGRANADAKTAATSSAGACADSAGGLRAEQCLRAKVLRIEDELARLASPPGSSDAETASQDDTRAMDGAQVLVRYRAFWSAPLTAIALTLAFSALAGGGFAMRAGMVPELNAYRAQLHQIHRLDATAARDSALALLAQLPETPPMPLLRNRIDEVLDTQAGTLPTGGSGDDLHSYWETVTPDDLPAPRATS